MANSHGTPIWYEYLAHDADAAQAFYAVAAGWTAAPSGMPGMDYRIMSAADGGAVAGLMALSPNGPPRPGWTGYYAVDDVDAVVAGIEAAGGRVHMPAMTLEGVGRMAMVADPQGATFYVMRGASDAGSTSFHPGQDALPGHFVWNELLTPDQDAAMGFYAGALGWRHEGGMPMGALGDYKFIHAGATCFGASMNTPPDAAPGWQFYVQTADIDAAVQRVTGAGGRVLQGPHPIPGGSFAVLAADPAGAAFGLVGPRP